MDILCISILSQILLYFDWLTRKRNNVLKVAKMLIWFLRLWYLFGFFEKRRDFMIMSLKILLFKLIAILLAFWLILFMVKEIHNIPTNFYILQVWAVWFLPLLLNLWNFLYLLIALLSKTVHNLIPFLFSLGLYPIQQIIIDPILILQLNALSLPLF